MKTHPTLPIPPSPFCTRGCTVTFQPNHTQLKENLSSKELSHFLTLYEEAESHPKETLPKVLAFAQTHPNLPQVDNLLTYLYIRMKKGKKADRLIEATYHRFPDSLIAKVNYADLLLRHKQPKKIPPLFGNLFDLSLLYPEKKEFHYSEFRGYMVAMSFYHHARKDPPSALECYRLAVLADPHHPSLVSLEKKLFHPRRRPFSNLLSTLRFLLAPIIRIP